MTDTDKIRRLGADAVEAVIAAVAFDERGLVPAIAQDASSRDVLMMAWMNAESLRETLTTGRVCYWSRSRKALWRKGETSGHVQHLVACHVDCDGDTLLLLVKQAGTACHTGAANCFFRRAGASGLEGTPETPIFPSVQQ